MLVSSGGVVIRDMMSRSLTTWKVSSWRENLDCCAVSYLVSCERSIYLHLRLGVSDLHRWVTYLMLSLISFSRHLFYYTIWTTCIHNFYSLCSRSLLLVFYSADLRISRTLLSSFHSIGRGGEEMNNMKQRLSRASSNQAIRDRMNANNVQKSSKNSMGDGIQDWRTKISKTHENI